MKRTLFTALLMLANLPAFAEAAAPDGEVHDTMVEIGYYHSAFNWPLVERHNDPEFGESQLLVQKKFTLDGFYGSLNTTPIPRVWPMSSQLMVCVGGAMGFDTRFRYEHELLESWWLGLELDGSWRVVQSYRDELGGTHVIKNNQPRDIRCRLTLNTMVELI